MFGATLVYLEYPYYEESYLHDLAKGFGADITIVICLLIDEYRIMVALHPVSYIIMRFPDVEKAHAHDNTMKEYVMTTIRKTFSFKITSGCNVESMQECQFSTSAIQLIEKLLYIERVGNDLEFTIGRPLNWLIYTDLMKMTMKKHKNSNVLNGSIVCMAFAFEDFSVTLLRLRNLIDLYEDYGL